MASPRSHVPSGSSRNSPSTPAEAASPRERASPCSAALADLATATRRGSPRHSRGSRCAAASSRRSWRISPTKSLQPFGSGAGNQPPTSAASLPIDGIVPLPGAEELQAFAGDAVRGEQRRERLEVLGPRGQEQRIDLPGLHGVCHLPHRAEHGVGVVRREGGAHHRPALRSRPMLRANASSAMPAVGRLRDQRREIAFAARQARRKRCAARRARRGSSKDRRRRRRPSRRWKRRSWECSTGAPPEPRPATSCAKSGPMISSAPSWSRALRRRLRARPACPWCLSARARPTDCRNRTARSSAACFSALATEGVLPEPVSGKEQTRPSPRRSSRSRPGAIGPGPLPPQAASSIANGKAREQSLRGAKRQDQSGSGSRMTPSLQGKRSASYREALCPRAADASLPSVHRLCENRRRPPFGQNFDRNYGSFVMGAKRHYSTGASSRHSAAQARTLGSSPRSAARAISACVQDRNQDDLRRSRAGCLSADTPRSPTRWSGRFSQASISWRRRSAISPTFRSALSPCSPAPI